MSGLKQLSPLSQAGVWALRLTVGAVFVLSGFAKADDLWGFVFKIEEYLQVWGIVQPRSLVIAAAMFIASFEFIAGVMLAALLLSAHGGVASDSYDGSDASSYGVYMGCRSGERLRMLR